MKTTNDDGVPQLLILDERSKRTTAELCGNQPEGHGVRCTLTKGHIGPHECLATRRGPIRWEADKAS
jgi:hypothetical protein